MTLLDLLIPAAHAQTAAQTAAGQSVSRGLFGLGPFGDIALFGLFFALMFFFTIRPQMKRDKERRETVNKLSVGDEVVVTGGLAGRVAALGEAYMTLEIAPGVNVKVLKSAVGTVLPKNTLKTL